MKLSGYRPILKFFTRSSAIGAIFIALALILTPGRTEAAELVMFEQAGCPWCQVFDREIASIYPKTDEGVRAPLRRVDLRGAQPPDLGFMQVERLTPLFVLVDKGREIGRIRGYPGEDNFWGLLGVLIKKLDDPGTSGEQAQVLQKTARAVD
jgi:hypothetical protein